MLTTSFGTAVKSALEALVWGAHCPWLGRTHSRPWQMLSGAKHDIPWPTLSLSPWAHALRSGETPRRVWLDGQRSM